jgi:hypothetical protein
MYSERVPPEEPPCLECRVDLIKENEEVAQVFMVTRHQTITAGVEGRQIDLSIPAVKIVMDLFGVKNQLECLQRVRKLWYEVKANAS